MPAQWRQGLGSYFYTGTFQFQDCDTKMIFARPLTLLSSLCLAGLVGLATSFPAAADDEFFERQVYLLFLHKFQ